MFRFFEMKYEHFGTDKLAMAALISEETQLKGMVLVWYKYIGKGLLEGSKTETVNTLPQKNAAIHICVDEISDEAAIANAMIKLMKFNMSARVQVHYVSPKECQYQLSSYGIAPQKP